MNLIWATRGRSWGFRFLLDGGYSDPLPVYEKAFAGAEGESTLCRRVDAHVACVSLILRAAATRQTASSLTTSSYCHPSQTMSAQLRMVSGSSGRCLLTPLLGCGTCHGRHHQRTSKVRSAHERCK